MGWADDFKHYVRQLLALLFFSKLSYMIAFSLRFVFLNFVDARACVHSAADLSDERRYTSNTE